MGIKVDHTHPGGKTCYVTRSPYRLTERGLFRTGDEQTFAVAYMPYTGSWYAYNVETGKEVAQFDRDFYECAIAPLRIGDLTPDPNCVPVS